MECGGNNYNRSPSLADRGMRDCCMHSSHWLTRSFWESEVVRTDVMPNLVTANLPCCLFVTSFERSKIMFHNLEACRPGVG